MQEFTIFDMVVAGITVILGLKGLFRGFIKEVLGIVGIIGGIFIASRFSLEVGNLVAPILALENEATIKLIGFIAALIGFWVAVYFIALVLSKITDLSGLGVVNRVLGFLFGSAKIFLIFSVIAYALYQVQSFKSVIDDKVGNSITFPYLIDVGGYIIKLDTTKVTKNIEEGVDSVVNKTKQTINKSIEEKVSQEVEKATKDVVENATQIKNNIEQNVEQTANEVENSNTQEETKK
ncbi:colicin V synthesis protein [Malaciobacter halophilus]|uniref:Colicin V synthesis protein n=1 Tax=Malaciobacter halophilus TaxID=197482 RepID=A0A2N1J5H3_9BACT|nr:CvpA family protein [Malaciobacter halophilus]AXH09178.1 CvpA family membrane protein [Malaciobacter halophilus]PKI81815.1 colicin V synthesis protein [Malaciobacter halophilus]